MSWWKTEKTEGQAIEAKTQPVVRELTARQALSGAFYCAALPFAFLLAVYAGSRFLDSTTPVITPNPVAWLFFTISFYLSCNCFRDYRTILRTGKSISLTPEVVAERQSQLGRYLLRCGMVLLSLLAAFSCLLLVLMLWHHKHTPPPRFWALMGLAEGIGWFGIRHGWNKLNTFDVKRLREASETESLRAEVTEVETPLTPKHWWTSAGGRESAPQKVGKGL